MATYERKDSAQVLAEVRAHTDSVRHAANGRWFHIFSTMVPGMFSDAMEKVGKHVTCPFHGGKADFRFIKTAKLGKGNSESTGAAMCTCGRWADGFALLQTATGMKFYDVVKAVDEILHGPGGSRRGSPVKALGLTEEQRKEKELEKARQMEAEMAAIRKANSGLWGRGKPLDLTTTPYYLKRGISREALAGLQHVREIASLPYFVEADKKGEKPVRIGNFPALIAEMLSPAGEQVALHRTWLSRDRMAKGSDEWMRKPGAKDFWKAKKLTESVGAAGAAIRLHDATGCRVLGLAEGVETGLAARDLAMHGYWPELGELPVWACYAERNIRSFEVPPDVLSTLEKIVIFADNDKSGVGFEAARVFQVRAILDYPALEVEIKVPPTLGDDWNDELLKWRATAQGRK